MPQIIDAPVTIGGIGGSGTRVVAELLKNMGFFIGNNLNESNDNMELAKLFPKLRELMHIYNVKQNPHIDNHIHARLNELTETMQNDMRYLKGYARWGWKTPTNFYILNYLNEHFHGVKYIHTIRHGLDMAYSSNQNQLYNWGFYFGIEPDKFPLPKASLQYWIMANNYAIALGNQVLKQNFYLLNFDKLCLEPVKQIQSLAQFLEVDNINVEWLSQIVRKPNSLGRYENQDLTVFDNKDFEDVRKFGFHI